MSDLSQLAQGGSPFAGIRPPDGPPMPAAYAAQAQRAAQPAPAPKPAKGEAGAKAKKKPIKPIALVVMLLLVGYVAKGKIVKPHYAPGEAVPLGQIIDLTQVTTNLADGHLAQLGVSLQMTKVGSSKEVTKDNSEILSTIVTDVGEETYATLLPPQGRAALQSKLLHNIQQDLGPVDGAEQVAAVYFTSFVLQ